MNINNINSEVATMESPPIDAHMPQALPSDAESVVKTEKIKELQTKEMAKAERAAQQEQALSSQETEEITIDLNEYMSELQTDLRFSMYEKLNHQVVVEIKNRKTDELIKQIPSEALLELRVKMEELTGLLLDEKI